MLRRARPTRVGGNIGRSLLEEVEGIGPDEIVVLELSSFQLEDAARVARSPHVAVVTCLSENHLDRHGTMSAYVDAKKNILRFQGPGDWAVLNEDDPLVRPWAAEARGRVVRYSACGPVEPGVFADRSTLVFHLGPGEERLDLEGRLGLRGRHNLANVLAAATAARLLGASTDQIAAAVAAFRPLPHRLEPVGQRDGVVFIDDSKATTPLAARLAIEAFTEPVVLIAGGYDKHVDPAPMVDAIRARAKAAVLLGATADALAAAIGQDATTVERASDLDDAVQRAVRLASPGDVVLLAPGHASWDMFDNYEQRGDVFRRAARRLGMKPLPADAENGGP
jgi:UDP-N-acetylmuramoylalanine--D-glutamate ligase